MNGRLGVAVVGFGWMGEAHSRAYLRVGHHFPDLARRPVLVAVAEVDQGRAHGAVEHYGFEQQVSDWRELVAAPGIDAVSITSPNFLHRDIGVAFAGAGKHLWIEKPVGLGHADALEVAAAVKQNGVQSTVGFNYRLVPAVVHACRLIDHGELGTITHARFHLFSDYAADPRGALSWRFSRARGGDGVLGDLASHGVDLIRHLLGEIDSVVADTATFISRRPRPLGVTSHFAVVSGSGEVGPVENEDYVGALVRVAGGARVVLEACRTSLGEQNSYGFAIHGTNGAIEWDFRRMGELRVSLGPAYQNQHFSTIYAGPGDGAFSAFQPGAGTPMSYDDLKVIEAAAFLRSIADGKPHGATIDDAVRSAQVLDAMTESSKIRTWVEVAG